MKRLEKKEGGSSAPDLAGRFVHMVRLDMRDGKGRGSFDVVAAKAQERRKERSREGILAAWNGKSTVDLLQDSSKAKSKKSERTVQKGRGSGGIATVR